MKRSILFISGLLATGIVFAQTATPPPTQDDRGDRMRNRWQERLDAKFGESDSNHDGTISQSEWQSARLRDATEQFQRMDTNRDGKLTRTEADQAFDHRMGGRDRERGERAERVRALDKDGDQQLSRAEIGNDMPRLAADFDRLDSNRDGKLSRDEIRAGRAPRDGR
jgi:Ca2+-binding EF-hand superfamily protein